LSVILGNLFFNSTARSRKNLSTNPVENPEEKPEHGEFFRYKRGRSSICPKFGQFRNPLISHESFYPKCQILEIINKM